MVLVYKRLARWALAGFLCVSYGFEDFETLENFGSSLQVDESVRNVVQATEKCTAHVRQGKVIGGWFEKFPSCEYRGIPFAEPPIGPLRFKPPKGARNFSNYEYLATEFGHGCIQKCTLQHPEITCPRSTSEDCLTLNVYTPHAVESSLRNRNLPVLVFFHGGNYVQGAGGVFLYHGSRWAYSQSVVIVTSNYRLGALGGLYTKRGDIQGNFQLQDQRQALKWVNENIAAFGGDPNQVTIFGQSAGGFSIASHLASPPSWPYFNRAIVMSDPVALPTETVHKSEQLSKMIVEKLGCSRWLESEEDECLRSVSSKAILNAQQSTHFPKIPGEILHLFMPYTPVIDPRELPLSPMQAAQAGKLANKPILIGSVRNESVQFIWEASSKKMPFSEYELYVAAIFGVEPAAKLFKLYGRPPQEMIDQKDVRYFLAKLGTDYIFTCSIQHFASAAAQHNPNVWVYYYDHVLSFNDYLQGSWIPECRGDLVCHGVDLPVLFDTAFMSPAKKHPMTTQSEGALSNDMRDVFTNFGVPGFMDRAGLPPFDWKKRNIIHFDGTGATMDKKRVGVLTGLREKYCQLFDQIGYEIN